MVEAGGRTRRRAHRLDRGALAAAARSTAPRASTSSSPTAARCATIGASARRRGRCCRRSACRRRRAPAARRSRTRSSPTARRTRRWRAAIRRRRSGSRFSIRSSRLTQPRTVAAIAGYDAISHAVESFVTTRRNEVSDLFARDAWRRLERSLRARARRAGRCEGARRHAARRTRGGHRDRAVDARRGACVREPADRATTATTHGVAIAVMLPHVVRWNAGHVGDRYGELVAGWVGLANRDVGAAPTRSAGSTPVRFSRRLEEWRGPASCRRRCAISACRATALPRARCRRRDPVDRHLQPAAVRRRRRARAVRARVLSATAAIRVVSWSSADVHSAPATTQVTF